MMVHILLDVRCHLACSQEQQREKIMSNVHSVLMFGFAPVMALPFPLDDEFWTSNEHRAKFAESIRDAVATGMYEVAENEDEPIRRLISNSETGAFLFTSEILTDEPLREGETGNFTVFANGKPKVTLISEKEANAMLDVVNQTPEDRAVMVRHI